MFQWLFTLLAAINKIAQATLSIAEAVDASAQTVKSAAIASIEDKQVKQQLLEADEFNRFNAQTKATAKKFKKFRKMKEEQAAAQPQKETKTKPKQEAEE